MIKQLGRIMTMGCHQGLRAMHWHAFMAKKRGNLNWPGRLSKVKLRNVRTAPNGPSCERTSEGEAEVDLGVA
jgi:hypothetical protein